MPVCVVMTEQTVRRTYAVPVFTEDDVPTAVASVSRGEWRPIDVDARSEILANRQVVPDELHDGRLSAEPPLDVRFGSIDDDTLADRYPTLAQSGAVQALIGLAWKLRHGDKLDQLDLATLDHVESIVVPAGFGPDDEGPDIEPEVVY